MTSEQTNIVRVLLSAVRSMERGDLLRALWQVGEAEDFLRAELDRGMRVEDARQEEA